MPDIIFGINPVLEILKSHPEQVHEVILPDGEPQGRKKEIFSLARQNNIKVRLIPSERFTRLVGKEAHQCVVAYVAPHAYQPLEVLLGKWRQSGEKALFLILDGIEDPRNFGALIRTANVAGAHGIIVPKDRSAPVNMAAAKAAAGALAHTPICRVPNLAAVLEMLKREGLWIVGTDQDADQSLYTLDAGLHLAIVVGGEGKGMHLRLKKACDFLVSIPTRGEIRSLNASVAGAVVLYEILRKRFYG